MIAQVVKTENKPLNDREQTFCKLMIPGTITATQAYRQAGYSHNGAKGNSSRLIAKEGIKIEIRRLRVELVVKDGITQEIQCKKLEDLRIRCKEDGDSTGENAAIREQNKLYGLSVDKSIIEQTEAQKARTATDIQQAKDFAKWQLKRSLARQEAVNEVIIDDV